LRYGVDTPRHYSEEEVEQINKMNAVGKRDPGIVPWTFETAKTRAQHLETAKPPRSDCVSQPQKPRVQPKARSTCRTSPDFSASSASLFASVETSVMGFSTKTSLPISSSSRHMSKCVGAGVTTIAASIFAKSERGSVLR